MTMIFYSIYYTSKVKSKSGYQFSKTKKNPLNNIRNLRNSYINCMKLPYSDYRFFFRTIFWETNVNCFNDVETCDSWIRINCTQFILILWNVTIIKINLFLSRSHDGERTKNIRTDGPEDAHVQVLDAFGVGDQHHKQS